MGSPEAGAGPRGQVDGMQVQRPTAYSPVIAAIRRYDPNLDVRWSWEKGKWALVYRPPRPDLIPPPVRTVRTAAGWVEERLPEKSEAHISFRTKTMPVGYVSNLSWHVFEQVVQTDTRRRGRVARQLARMQEIAERDRRRIAKDRWKEARKYMLWHARTHPMSV